MHVQGERVALRASGGLPKLQRPVSCDLGMKLHNAAFQENPARIAEMEAEYLMSFLLPSFYDFHFCSQAV
jgi:hypothetical protein